jgi:hypothetical protein
VNQENNGIINTYHVVVNFPNTMIFFCPLDVFISEINHGSQNVLGVLTWIGGY